jgi:polyisoprenyl-teichoic acid--peptidoglycan teichoic acid transferase
MARRRPQEATDSAADQLDVVAGDESEDGRFRRSWFQRVILLLGVLTVMGCIATVGFISVEALRLSDIDRKDVNLASTSDDEPQNWLVVGSDSREVISKNDPNAAVFTGGGESTSGQRSDTIMIVRVDPKAEHLEILSLQRDLWVPIARAGTERINTAYSFPDGPQRLIDTIKQDFNIDINHYVEINFASFEGIVNAVGGLPMYFDKPMHDPNSGLQIDKVGCVTLDGNQALAFARSRHLQYSDGLHWIDDPSADLGRISRQQYFMRKMFDRAGSRSKNPVVLHDLIDVATKYIGLDKQIDITKAIAMGERFATFKGDSIKSYTLPVLDVTKPGGARVLELDKAGAQPILAIFRGVPPDDADPSTVKFTVENGSGVSGQAAEVQKAFQAIGYQASGAKDHGSTIATTQIRFAPGSDKLADQIARHLTSGAEVVADPTLAAGKIVLVTGNDFTTVMRRPREANITNGTTAPGSTAPPSTTASSTSTSSTAKGAKSSSTTSTTAPNGTNNDGTHAVGIVPGEPPPGTTCE